MSAFDKARQHAAKFFSGSKEVGDCIDKMSAAALGLGLADPSGTTLTLTAAANLGAKATSAISSAALLVIKATEPTGTDGADRRLTLFLLITNEAYFQALADVLKGQPDGVREAVLPRTAKDETLAAAESEDVFQLLAGRAKLFQLYEDRLKLAQTPAGAPLEERDHIAAAVTAAAMQNLSALLARSDEPYATLARRLHNEALSAIPQKMLEAGAGTHATSHSVPPLSKPATTGGSTGDSAFAAEFLERLQRIEDQTRAAAGRVAIADSGHVAAKYQANKGFFDRAKAQLEKGRTSSALAIFEQVAEELAGSTDADAIQLRARALGNVGHCLHRMGRSADAIPFFREGHRLAPAHVRLRVNLAIADLQELKTESGEAILCGLLAENPAEPDVVELLAESMLRRGDAPGALALLLAHTKETENHLCLLSRVQAQLGDHEAAMAAALRAVEKIPNADTAEFSAGVLLAERVFADDEGVVNRFKLDAHERLKGALKHFKRAIDIIRKEENPVVLSLYLTNISAVYGALGEREQALRTGQEAWDLGSRDHQLQVNLFAAYLAERKIPEALEVARSLRSHEPLAAALAKELHAHLIEDNFDAIIVTYDEMVRQHPELRDDVKLTALRIHAQRLLPDVAGAKAELNEALAQFGRQFPLVLEEAHSFDDQHDFTTAEARFLEAERLGEDGDKYIGRVQCGLFFARQGRYAEAVHRLVAPDEEPLTSGVLVDYLGALTELNRLPEVAAIGLRVIETKRFKRQVWHLTGWALAALGRLKEAEKVLRELVQHDPSERNHIDLGGVCFRYHGGPKAITVLESARSRHPDSYVIHVNLSGLYFGEKQYRKAFEAAKRAVEINPTGKEGHGAMVRMLAAGDRIKLNTDEVKLLHASLEQASGIVKIEMPVKPDGDIDLTQMQDMLKAHSEDGVAFMKDYREKRFPISIVSRVLGKPLLDTWLTATHSPGWQYYFTAGTTQEQADERALAEASTEVVLDASSLLTLQALGQLDLLPKLFTKIHVTTSTREKFVDELRELEAFAVSPATIGYVEGGIRLQETGEPVHAAKLAVLRPIVTFLDSSQVNIEGMDQQAWTTWQQLKKVPAFADWIIAPGLLARTKQCPLFSDEMVMKLLAAQQFGAVGFCTQAMLRAAMTRGLLTVTQVQRATMKLVDLNYVYVSLALDDLVLHLAETKHVKSPAIAKAFRLLESSNYTDHQSVRILGGVAATLWFNTDSTSPTTREEWINTCLASLNAAKDRRLALMEFVAGALLPLIDFPEAYTAFCLHLGRHPSLSPKEQQVVDMMAGRVVKMMPKQTALLTPRALAAWQASARWLLQKLRIFRSRPPE